MPPDAWPRELEAWRAMRGVIHLCVYTAGCGLKTPGDPLQTLRRFTEVSG